MGFELKILQNEDLDLIYEVAEKCRMSNELRSRYAMDIYLGNFKLAVDIERQIFMFPLMVNRDDARDRFILGFKGGIVVFFGSLHHLYSIEKISPHLLECKDEIESIIREIFLTYGAYVDGDNDRHPVLVSEFLWNVGGEK